MDANRKELVVCRYGKGRHCDWIEKVDFPVLIYNKGPDDQVFSAEEIPKAEGFPSYEIVDLENVSYEDYVMLRHILDRWDRLADVTVFAQDDANTERHAGPAFVETINRVPATAQDTIPIFAPTASDLHKDLQTSDDAGGSCPELPVREIYEELFGLTFPGKIRFMASALLAVPRVVIRGRPRSFYGRALKILEREFAKLNDMNRQVCTCTFERLWLEVFSGREKTA